MKKNLFSLVGLTAAALFAFAANSVLCRLALGGRTIDATSFTAFRLGSGAIALWLMWLIHPHRKEHHLKLNWLSAVLLFAYAIAFSFAYLGLSAGTGALLLFGAVQATMLGWALRLGERPHVLEWLGLVIAIAGLVYLVFPGLTAPSPFHSGLMVTAGISWGWYSLRGRGSRFPLADTASNFLGTVPLALLGMMTLTATHSLSPTGVLVAVMSGAVTSGVGYVIWYAALKHLTATQAATVQLAVPILAAFGGVVLLAEPVTLRLLVASILILGGVGVALTGRALFKK
ncbi:MAG: DMT family transporter [Blastocatellia bacterium]|nr:DMT family transporter [Blastocatellia bacterium]